MVDQLINENHKYYRNNSHILKIITYYTYLSNYSTRAIEEQILLTIFFRDV